MRRRRQIHANSLQKQPLADSFVSKDLRAGTDTIPTRRRDRANANAGGSRPEPEDLE